MEFELDHDVDGTFDVVVVRGELDLATHTQLKDKMADILNGGRSNLVVDLSETTFLDSTALGGLIGARARAVQAGGSFSVIASEPRIVKLFEITRLSEVFTRHESREDWKSAVGA